MTQTATVPAAREFPLAGAVSTLRSILSTAKSAGLQAWYARRYGELSPREYSTQEFRRVSEEAWSLLTEIRETLGPLPTGVLQPYWADALARLRDVLDGPLPQGFLSIPAIRQAMVRRGWTEHQEFELRYLRQQGPLYQRIRESFRDSRVGWPHLECRDLGCSSSALGYLYYLARLQHYRARYEVRPPATVTELGGGFGGFCRVYLWAHPVQTYTIVDLPEFTAVQYLFLKLSLPSHTVTVVRSPTAPLPEQGIRLVPIQVALKRPELLKTGLFTSHFALTEAGETVRQLVYGTQFFSAEEVFYIGQQSSRWPVSVDPEILAALSEGQGWRRSQEPFHMKDCVEIYGKRREGR